jgi:hypothetical protein
VPTVEGLRFEYALHELPPGRWAVARWRWELWHGAHLIATGWHSTRVYAERCLRRHAARVGSRMMGLRAPDPEAFVPGGDFRLGATVQLVIGGVPCRLVPRALEGPDRSRVASAA